MIKESTSGLYISEHAGFTVRMKLNYIFKCVVAYCESPTFFYVCVDSMLLPFRFVSSVATVCVIENSSS